MILVKNQVCLLLAAVSAACSAGASDAVSSEKVRIAYGPGGRITAPGMTGELVVYAEGWAGSARPQKSWKLPDAKTGRAEFEATGAKGLSVVGRVEARDSSTGVIVRASVESRADAKPECVAYAFDFDVSKCAGWTWSATCAKGPVQGTVPASFGKLALFSGLASAFSLQAPDGRRGYTWTFPVPRPILLQDNRRWGPEIVLRIGSRPLEFTKGTKVGGMDFTLSAVGGQVFDLAKPYVIKAGQDWVPVDYRKDVVPGSALDFSGLGVLDAPAGKYGWLRNVNGDFVFEGRPGGKQRFYGVNLCFDANTPSHEVADQLLARLSRLGYNSIRIHHYERAICRDRWKGGTGFDPQKVDLMDYLIAKGIERGFYFTTDVFVSRTVLWEDVGLAERGKGQQVPMQTYKALVAVWDPAFEDWKRFAREFFEHVNPYTGRAYRDEPGLPLISLINEGQLTMGWGRGLKDEPVVDEAYRTWLAAKRAADPSFCPKAPEHVSGLNYYDGKSGRVMAAFMADVERRSAVRMKEYLRSIGVKALLTNANCGPHPAEMASVRGDVYDYTDDHFYVDHPQFLDQRWRLPSKCANANPVKTGVSQLKNCAFTRFAGQPMCITEWNFSGPGMYRGVGGILTGAFAALQDWSGVWRFAYSHNEPGLRSEVVGVPGYFDVASDLLGLMSDKASLCLFLRGDLERAADAVAFEADLASFPADRTRNVACRPEKWDDLAWRARTAVTAPGHGVPAGLRRRKMSETYFDTPFADSVAAPRALRLDVERGSFVLDTPRTSGGFAESGRLDCGALSFEPVDAPATVWASSVDVGATDLAHAGRIAVFHLTDVQANGNVYQDETKKVLFKWGKAPSLVRAGRAHVVLRLAAPEAYEVWALRTDGSRIGRIPSRARDGGLAFDADVKGSDGACVAYEAVRR